MQSEQLKALRKKLKLSLSEAAAQVRVTSRTWARYEAGERKIPDGVVELFHLKNGLKYKD